jgi:hypothetical protein
MSRELDAAEAWEGGLKAIADRLQRRNLISPEQASTLEA